MSRAWSDPMPSDTKYCCGSGGGILQGGIGVGFFEFPPPLISGSQSILAAGTAGDRFQQ
jgi:hypothetical protein